ncbi:MAG: glycoside hydrolase family 127 protein [Spirochaetales bacterium]|nr:glycoside hydrolase family 127 protein [Spirochaetales bacterium]
MNISTASIPKTIQKNRYYESNRAPLIPNPLSKLPLGSIKPEGWLKHQLELMVEGMTGRLTEISSFLTDDNGWFGTEKEGWEEQPYWFRGFYDLAVLTKNERLNRIKDKWIEKILTSQTTEGYFGASCHRLVKGKNGKGICDLWPHMMMLDAIIHHYEFTSDKRVVPFVTRFFAFCRDLSEAEFMPKISDNGEEVFREEFDDWKITIQVNRAGDMLPHIYWLYNITGDTWLLNLGTRFFDHIMPAKSEYLDPHIVNFTQRYGYSGIYSQQSNESRHLKQSEYWYSQHMFVWGQQPRGIFGADEGIRPGKTDPRQGFETCGMIEFAKNFYLLGRITGSTLYADRCEDVMLNHFPAAQTPDLSGLHYLTASNLPQLDSNDNHDFLNEQIPGNQQLPYSPHKYRCCQHNVAMGWPWYAQNLWQATSDNGLAAYLYAASSVTAKVGENGDVVTLTTQTDYPFKGDVNLSVEGEGAFPLYLRVPKWCTRFNVKVNNKIVEHKAEPGYYLRIEREWCSGDAVEISMAMKPSLTEWPRNGSVTVDRGPLSYSVRIEEEWRKWEGTKEWPQWEVFPKSPWNYGLIIDRDDPSSGIKVEEKEIISDQPWTVNEAPIELSIQAKKIPLWKLGEDNTVAEIPQNPDTTKKEETITMIPLGCARLRMSCLPVVKQE